MVKSFSEATKMAIHARHLGGDKFKVEKIGNGVKTVKVGDSLKSSDLDDLQNNGHVIRELKKTLSEQENIQDVHKNAENLIKNSLDDQFNHDLSKNKLTLHAHVHAYNRHGNSDGRHLIYSINDGDKRVAAYINGGIKTINKLTTYVKKYHNQTQSPKDYGTNNTQLHKDFKIVNW